jgi:hypothetical protein
MRSFKLTSTHSASLFSLKIVLHAVQNDATRDIRSLAVAMANVASSSSARVTAETTSVRHGLFSLWVPVSDLFSKLLSFLQVRTVCLCPLDPYMSCVCCVVLRCDVLSCVVLSCLVLCRVVLSCLALPCLVLSCLVLSCLVLPCLVLCRVVLSCLVLPCLVLSCLVISCYIL